MYKSETNHFGGVVPVQILNKKKKRIFLYLKSSKSEPQGSDLEQASDLELFNEKTRNVLITTHLLVLL